MNRLKDNRGETLIESLVSLLILTMTFAFLAVASTTAARYSLRCSVSSSMRWTFSVLGGSSRSTSAFMRRRMSLFGMRRKALTMQGSSFRAPFRLMALKAAYRP